MSDRTAIEWTDATWNPVNRCTEVSPGLTKRHQRMCALWSGELRWLFPRMRSAGLAEAG